MSHVQAGRAQQSTGVSDAQTHTTDTSRLANETPTSETPTSTEQGQTLIDQTFERRSYEEWKREIAREAFRDTKFSAQARSVCFNSDNLNGTENEACALGGSAGFKTGYFSGLLSLGASAYTSQRLYGPPDKDGTQLLAPGEQLHCARRSVCRDSAG